MKLHELTPSAAALRPKWGIDHTLDALLGHEIRVAASAFLPEIPRNAEPRPLVRVEKFFLPDNSQAAGLPVYFEGKLRHFSRRIGVVHIVLDALSIPDTASDGTVPFRGKIAVIVKGPAIVELAFPFHVERLPRDPNNYWRDLQVPRAQFELGFSVDV